MEWLILAVLVGAMVAALLALRRRRTPVEEDEWTLPPIAGAAPEGPTHEVLDRDALLNRSRTYDPRGWDDTPDGEEPEDDLSAAGGPGDPVEGDLPRYFDRDYLESRKRDHEEE